MLFNAKSCLWIAVLLSHPNQHRPGKRVHCNPFTLPFHPLSLSVSCPSNLDLILILTTKKDSYLKGYFPNWTELSCILVLDRHVFFQILFMLRHHHLPEMSMHQTRIYHTPSKVIEFRWAQRGILEKDFNPLPLSLNWIWLEKHYRPILQPPHLDHSSLNNNKGKY